MYMHAKRSHTYIKDRTVHVQVWQIMETHKKIKKKECTVGWVVQLILSQLAFPRESDPNFCWDKSQ